MIVRIVTEGQFRLDDQLLEDLNQLDNQLVAVVEQKDREEFHKLFRHMLDMIRTRGTPVGPDELVTSDVVIPPPDATFEEAAGHFVGEGIITG